MFSSNPLASLLSLSLGLPIVAAALRGTPATPISVLRSQAQSTLSTSELEELAATYPAYTISTPIDHFHNDSLYEPHANGSYEMRYWFDAQYYKTGGPVIVLASGEADGTGRLPYLQKGIVAQLAEATNGIGVILEHRYYGDSLPVEDFTTENLRFLTTDQALADAAYFAQNVKYAGLEDVDLTSNTTPYIAYGGSYAGAFTGILRKLYPDVYFGAISSSGVTEAIWDYWQYYEAARRFGPPACIETTQKVTNIVDNILIGHNGTKYVTALKKVFGMSGITDDADFANALSGGISALQNYNWDPTQSSSEFWQYCNIVSNDTVLYPRWESLRPSVEKLIAIGGWANETEILTNRTLNYIGFVRGVFVESCEGDQNDCFGTNDPDFYAKTDIAQTWKSWPYQYCTQWGFLSTGSGVPADQLPLISRTITIPYLAKVCVESFNITEPANVTAINKYGGWELSYPRLAQIDGEWDPWRDATPHAIGLPTRNTTTEEPYHLIAQAVHHWDENGLYPNETTPSLPPAPVKSTQEYEAQFVQQWLTEWKQEREALTAHIRAN
ncbi:peptidase S28 [Xylariales sp. PMI_506]|nr:peptidase S28 [Xylariales sp. PMI_506]